MTPTLEEFCRTSAKVSQPYFFQSRILVLAMVMAPFSPKIWSSGRTTPSSRAAAARITLKVEPGSKGSVMARLRSTSREGTLANVLGLNVGRMATARRSPVCGSITRAMAALALVRR